ncbi:MBL fold metallo-hydrolase [Hasllibacter sp. MH4015]|uniref:MBL fold metallo-hydrolase n=1 Tax=Hasllibacter sp. MH4015 TaxID=2854029 RepID=UPI001CD51809|nr:MBL fold metallo-hydrolase [Hasllibacter sp. MH4015]
MPSRRQTMFALSAAAGTLALPFRLRAEGHGGDLFETPIGPVTVHPISHASIVLETPMGTIHVDPVGGGAAYDGLPEPDLVLITHEHSDHYDEATLAAIRQTDPHVIANPAVHGRLADATNSEAIANGQETIWGGVLVQAIPAYNTTEGRLNFHPEGRDNGYVLDLGGFRIYISGDTEDIPEMRALEGIDLAFVCMNLPFTMDAAAAADAVRAFGPRYVYPYHYRGRDNGTQDPAEFAEMVGEASEVRFGDWYE